MKRILTTLVIATMILLPSLGQENEEKLKELEKLEEGTANTVVPDTLVLDEEFDVNTETDTVIVEEETDFISEDYDDGTSTVRIGRNIIIEESDDSVVIRVGEKEIVINEDEEDTTVDFNNYSKERRSRQFQGHLGGIELGFNSYFNDDWAQTLDAEDNYMNLNTAKSSCFNFYSPNVSLGITKRFGLVSSIGFNFSNYRFDGNNTIYTDENGIVTPLYPAVGINYEKSKLATIYAVLPVMLEAQIPVTRGSAINIGAGVIGAVKLGSHTKVVYYEDGKQIEKDNDDFSLNLLRYGVTARIGYEMLQVYGTCYLSEMFEDGKGPRLHPFEVGIALTIND